MATTNKLRSIPSFIFLSLALLFHFYLCMFLITFALSILCNIWSQLQTMALLFSQLFIINGIFDTGKGDLLLNYYSESCPNAEDIIKQEVTDLYNKHGNTAVSWVRNLFHDCMVKVYCHLNMYQIIIYVKRLS